MSSLTTPAQAATALFGIMPCVVTQATMDEYGLVIADGQVPRLTRELLILNLFWVVSVLDATLSDKDRDRVFTALLHRVTEAWALELGLPDDLRAGFEDDLRHRHTQYAEVVQNGGVQVSVLTEAAGAIEAEGIVPEAARPMLLALLIDLDPSGDIGETIDEIDLAG
jgi:hypothetical protein